MQKNSKLRITKSTPSFDPIEPPWDRVMRYSDGRFWEYGSRGLNKYDRRLLYVLLSHMPVHMVSVCGRALIPNQMHADFLSIRVGANRTTLVPLSLKVTAFITIDVGGKVVVEKHVRDFDEFVKSIPPLAYQISPTERFEFRDGGLRLVVNQSN